VLDITTVTVSAASALNVDFGQAQRDISLMVRGAAGMDVKLFSLLRSTGAIAESTEDWNKKLTAAERVNKLSDALGKFRSAGDKYAKSWAGVTATFGGIVQEFGRAGMAPILSLIGYRLEKVNDYLLENRASIEATLTSLGNRTANALDSVFTKAQNGFEYTVKNWDRILGKISEATEQMRRFAPLLAAAYGAKALAGGGSGVLNAFGVGGDGGGGLAAGKFAGGAAGAAGVGAAGGGAAGAGGFLAAISGPLVAALAAAGAVAAFASDHFQAFSAIWENMTAGMGGQLMELWESLKGAFLPLLKNWGGVISVLLLPVLQLLMFSFRGLIKALTLLLDGAAAVYGWIYDKLNPAFTFLLDLFVQFGDALRDLGKILGFEVQKIRGFTIEDKEAHKYEGGFDAFVADKQGFMGRRLNGDPEMAKQAELLRTMPAQRSTTVNDFRGSRITVKQEFAGKHDPDRILQAMVSDITRQAERRISSGYMPALAR
jgi:hypothetical protein